MKKGFIIFNAIMFVLTIALDIVYALNGGLLLKAFASLCFVLLGAGNLVYCLKSKTDKKYAIWLVVALFIAMLGDIAINLNFIIGAVVFAIGHIFYFVAYCFLHKICWKDLICASSIFVFALLIILLSPQLKFDGIIMKLVCVIYALIISFMLGKALSNFITKHSTLNLVILIGSILFFFSDAMLLFDVFGAVPATGLLCLFTYYPGQFVLAHSIFTFVNANKTNQSSNDKK